LLSKIAAAEQLRALQSPLRQERLDLLVSPGGDAEVARLAALLGRPADGLYYHLDLMVKARLLRRLDQQSGDRRY